VQITKTARSKLKTIFINNVLRILVDAQVQKKIQEIVQTDVDLTKGWQGNIRTQLWKKATAETVDYVSTNMIHVKSCKDRRELLENLFPKVKIDGINLEFGVGEGSSIRAIAKYIKGTIHGFDSFEGLPEVWFDHFCEGSFAQEHQLPLCPSNVQLHVGMFDKTLPDFLKNHSGQIGFMHVDCDLYSSTKVIFDNLRERISSGTVILFDEYFNYPGWQNHEFKAFQEFVTQNGLSYEYLSYDRCHFAVAVRIL
jgi:hypothetical protein